MEPNPLDAYQRASTWTATKVAGAATKLDEPTPCDKWNVRTLMNHMLETQRYFVGASQQIDAQPSKDSATRDIYARAASPLAAVSTFQDPSAELAPRWAKIVPFQV